MIKPVANKRKKREKKTSTNLTKEIHAYTWYTVITTLSLTSHNAIITVWYRAVDRQTDRQTSRGNKRTDGRERQFARWGWLLRRRRRGERSCRGSRRRRRTRPSRHRADSTRRRRSANPRNDRTARPASSTTHGRRRCRVPRISFCEFKFNGKRQIPIR